MNTYSSETIRAKATKLFDKMSYYCNQRKFNLKFGHALYRLYK